VEIHTSEYLAWNGEVYDLQRQRSRNDDDYYENYDDNTHKHTGIVEEEEDVSNACVSDTEVVADLLRRRHSFTGNKNEIDDDGEEEERDADTKRIATVLRQCINAEYAFVILTDTYVYYGRDPLGRRSLLIQNNINKNNNNNNQEKVPSESVSSSFSSSSKKVLFQVASVATEIPSTTRTTTITANTAKDDENENENDPAIHHYGCWQEVEPGFVHCYDWRSNTFGTSVPIILNDVVSILPRIIPNASSQDSSIVISNPLQQVDTCNGATMEHSCDQFREVLQTAVRKRCSHHHSSSSRSNRTIDVGILFSGGLDSTVIAAMALECVDQITLLNVSFVDDHNNIKHPDNHRPDTCRHVVAADTLAAMASYQELQAIYPNKKIRFCHRKVDWNEIVTHEPHIRQLIYPKTTVMDVNIAMALWFAASAATTDAPRLLLSGLGADELLGGYRRHQIAWEQGTLRQELDRDIHRLWERNLGRDDRVLSDCSKEVRFPFLDVHVMQFLQNQPLEHLVAFRHRSHRAKDDLFLGDKRILRLLAQRMGLVTASCAVKRAIQFGSRISHVSDKRRFGSRRKATGEAKLLTSS
jgi:asparagine synthetase B (glutamine-hydrolysing)